MDLTQARGLRVLETDYRDSIRPLALGNLYTAEIFKRRRDYSTAKEYYHTAEALFRMLSWQEDRFLRKMKRQEFNVYQHGQLLKCKWESIKCDINELLFSTFAGYRRVIGRGLRRGELLNPEKGLKEIEKFIAQAQGQKESYRQVLEILNKFFDKESKALPEAIARQKIHNMRQWDKTIGGQRMRRYNTMKRIRDFTFVNEKMKPHHFIGELIKQFPKGSLEAKYLNEFAYSFAKGLRLTKEDRKVLVPLNDNIDNLLEILNPEKRLAGGALALRRWVEQRMRATGIDDLFIAVSPQAKLLEEVDVYRVSMHSHLDTFEDYNRMTEIVDGYLKEVMNFPSRVSDPETVWQMCETAAMTAEFREDWIRSEKYHRYLLKPENNKYFAQLNKYDKYRAQMGIARALINLGREQINDIAYIEDDIDKQLAQTKLEASLREARDYLQQLAQLPGTAASQVTTRIRAKEMINELNAM
jgi:hypothetical protein